MLHRDWTIGLQFKEHDRRYLLQCFYNLQEKYDRGQKDFTSENYKKIGGFYKKGIDFCTQNGVE